MPQFRAVPLDFRPIPPRLRELVEYLNRLLVGNQDAITTLVDGLVVLVDEQALRTAAPRIQLRKESLDTTLSILGLLGGFANDDEFRLYAEFENDKPPYGRVIKFGVLQVLP